ncbi:MAG: reverse transcriptase domain-containing protein, partial [Bacteroidota bacterium]
LGKEEPEDYNTPEFDAAKASRLASMMELNVFTPVNPSKNIRPIPGKWVLSRRTTGEAKARYVAKGYLQDAKHIQDNYSPVIAIPSIKLMISLSLEDKALQLIHVDISTAYLYAQRKDDDHQVYLYPPSDIAKFYPEHEGKVYRVNAALDGLIESAMLWYRTLIEYLEAEGFVATNSDHCVLKRGEDIIGIYVDDLLILSRSPIKVIETLKKRFKIKVLGTPKKLLGVTFEYLQDGIALGQEEYIEELLKKLNLQDIKTNNYGPISSEAYGLKISKDEDQTKYPYRQAIGSLLFLARSTRPDICFPTVLMSSFSSGYNDNHWKQVVKILKYLKRTKGQKLIFKRYNNYGLQAYSDSDYASEELTRHSYSGYMVLHNGNLIGWNATRQKTIALSTAEAETYAVYKCMKEAIYLNRLLTEMRGQPFENTPTDEQQVQVMDIYIDNTQVSSAIKEGAKARTKHYDVYWKMFKDMSNIYRVKDIDTNENISDMLTKILTLPRIEYIQSMIHQSTLAKDEVNKDLQK